MKTSLVLALAIVALTQSLRAAETAVAGSPVFASLKGDLVVSGGKQLKKFDEAPLAGTKYYALYYSAAWCGPCRAFTPDLVKWYKRNKNKNPHFELIFVSSDKSEEEMAGYMKEDDMPWPALDYAKKSSKSALTKYGGRGIPNLVLIDDQGTVLSQSYEGQNYVGPRKVLEDIEKTLKSNPASADAKDAAAKSTSSSKPGNSSFDEFFKKKPAAQ